jgi:hypothetical protein
MNLRSLVVVGLRLVVLNFFLREVLELGWAALTQKPITGQFNPIWLLIFIAIVGSALLWAFTPDIATAITRGIPGEISLGAPALVDCYTIGFVALGIYYMASDLPALFSWVIYIFRSALQSSGTEWRRQIKFADFVVVCAWFLLGCALVLNARVWGTALATKQKQMASTAEPTPPADPEAN